MGNYTDVVAASKGEPNIEYLAYLQDNWTPTNIRASLQFAVKKVTATAVAGLAITIPEGAEIIDAWVICTSTNGSGTMQIKTGADTPSDITDAIACETDKAIDRAATIDDAYNVVGADGVKVFSNGALDRGDVYIAYLK